MAENVNKQIEDIISRLQESRDIAQFFQDIARFTSLSSVDAKALAEALKGVSKNTKDIAFNFEEAAKGAKKVTDAQKDLGKAQKTQRSLGIEINKLLKQQGFNQGEINKLLNGTVDDREYLKKLAQQALDIDLGAIDAAIEGYTLQQKNVADAEESLRIAKNYNSALGLTGGLVSNAGSAMKKLGVDSGLVLDALEDAKDSMLELAEELTDSGDKAASFGDKMSIMSKGLGTLTKNVAKGLVDPLFLGEQLLDAVVAIDEQTGELAKNFGISYNQAAGISDELNSAANNSYLLNVTTKGLTEAFIELNNRYGTFAELNENTLNTFTDLKAATNLSGEALGALYDTSVLTGKELEDITKEFMGQAQALAMENGLALNQKDILETIKDVSDATLLTLQAEPEALAKAVFQAKALGVSLGEVEKIADSLLQFESSISKELEAEVMTGKQLNLERARQAALEGDIATVAEEIAKQVGTSAEFSQMNVLAQQSLAESLGMTRQELAGSLKEREALAVLSAKEGESAQQAFNRKVQEVGLEEAKKQLGDEQYANLLASQSIQERFAAAATKLQEVFVSLAEPLLPVLDVFAQILSVVSPIVAGVGDMVKFLLDGIVPLKTLVGLLVAYKGVQLSINIAKQAQLAYGMLMYSIETRQVSLAATKEALEGKSLALKIATYTLALKDLVVSKLKIGYEKISGLVQKRNLLTSIGQAAMSALRAFATAGPLGWGLGLAAAAGATALGYQFLKDGMIGPDGGLVVSGEKGTYKLDKNDTVVAGTDLGKRSEGGGAMVDMGPVVAKLEELLSVVRAGGTITIDGQAVGKALTLASYST